MPPHRIPLYYTFGNHSHWVDMEWLWGYHVAPGSVHDMLAMADALRAKGNVNFDAVGYEKLASEAPEAMTALRQAVESGQIEPVGCSYAQPYGLFHGGESNVRHRVYGARAVRRLLGKWPQTFWEEEFDFFPQLPQMLAGCGFKYASLFFQWTWHTPEVPRETVPAVWWEGQDGSRLLTATRNALNLHQWPEDIQILLGQLAAGDCPVTSEAGVPPLVLQWVELMPSPDWMCRFELLLPKLLPFLADERFDVRPCTLSDYLALFEEKPESVPVRKYTLDDVWHGMSLGKNADTMRRESQRLEGELLAAESLATVLGMFGRPYPRWDVYPVWELEEAWRHLLTSQHHDNDECEVLCGHVAQAMHGYADSLSPMGYLLSHLAERTGANLGDVVFNPLSWPVLDDRSGQTIPPMGYSVAPKVGQEDPVPDAVGIGRDTQGALAHNGWTLEIDGPDQRLDLRCELLPEGCLREMPFVTKKAGGEPVSFDEIEGITLGNSLYLTLIPAGAQPFEGESVAIEYEVEADGSLRMWTSVEMHEWDGQVDALNPDWMCDPGMNAGYRLHLAPAIDHFKIVTDSPYAVHEVHPNGEWPKKYPTGDWMTSQQWFETIKDPFHSSTFVDLVGEDGRGLMIVHESSQQWFRTQDGVAALLTMRDPWDNGLFNPEAKKEFHLVPHGPWTNRDRWKTAQTILRAPVRQEFAHYARGSLVPEVDMPQSFAGMDLVAEHSLVTAFYRESEDAGRHVEGYAGEGMGYPTVVRIVEFNGVGETAVLKLPGEIAAAYKTNLLGGDPIPLSTGASDWTVIEVPLAPFEVATVYLDVVLARKQIRDLDAERRHWATVHRVE